jgi:hypothetical protein
MATQHAVKAEYHVIEVWLLDLSVCQGRRFTQVVAHLPRIRQGNQGAAREAFRHGAYRCVATFTVECGCIDDAIRIVSDITRCGEASLPGRSWIECIPDLPPEISVLLSPSVVRQRFCHPTATGSVFRALSTGDYYVQGDTDIHKVAC